MINSKIKRKNNIFVIVIIFFIYIFSYGYSEEKKNSVDFYVLIGTEKIKVKLGEIIPSNVIILMSKIKKDFPYLVFWGKDFLQIPYLFQEIDSYLKDNPIDNDPKIGTFPTKMKFLGTKVEKIKLVSYKGRLMQIILGLHPIKPPQGQTPSLLFFNFSQNQQEENKNTEENIKIRKKRFSLYKKMKRLYGSPIFYKITSNNYPISISLQYCYPLWIQSGIAITLNLGETNNSCKDIATNYENTPLFSWISFTHIKLYKEFLKKRDEKYREKYYPYLYQKAQ